MLDITPPYYPIIYVRGYAMTRPEIEETVSDPYMGFNIGSSKIRQLWDGKIGRFYFESPLVRLMKEYDYRDVFEAGDFTPERVGRSRLVVIYRYYESASKDLGQGKVFEIEQYAEGLAELIARVRDAVCGSDAAKKKTFRIYLVAHSMGGLICRSFLQRPLSLSSKEKVRQEMAAHVDKVFTYGTPHNGIELRGIGNVPGFLTAQEMDNFNRDRMKKYLGLTSAKDVSTLDGKFDPDRFFTLVGTNHKDYPAALGIAREIVGPMSDGLVKIENATVWGPWKGKDVSSPRAFVHRSHSGPYGLVNSEEGFQNLRRFFYGDTRVDGVLHIDKITLPTELHNRVEKDPKLKKKLKASYHFETAVTVRGLNVYLHRRTIDENSAILKTYEDLTKTEAGVPKPGSAYLFSVYLSSKLRTTKDKETRVGIEHEAIAFAADVRVRVPEYELDGTLWFDEHFAGGLIFGKRFYINLIPPKSAGTWQISWRDKYEETETKNDVIPDANGRFMIPVVTNERPGISARLEIIPSLWS